MEAIIFIFSNTGGFFFDRASLIVKNEGIISPFSHPQISSELQSKYTQLLNEFIVPNNQF